MMYVVTVSGGWSRRKPTIHGSPRSAVDHVLRTIGPCFSEDNRKAAVRFIEGIDAEAYFLLREQAPNDGKSMSSPYISIVQAEVVP